jgi:hypothetical protein
LTGYRDRRIMTSTTNNPLPSFELEDHISSGTLQPALGCSGFA